MLAKARVPELGTGLTMTNSKVSELKPIKVEGLKVDVATHKRAASRRTRARRRDAHARGVVAHAHAVS